MNPGFNRLLAWCQEQLIASQRQIELMESGALKTHESKGGPLVDTTDFWITENKRIAKDMESIIADIKRG